MRPAPGLRRLASSLLAAAVLLAGCSPVLERKPVEKQRFVLQPPPAEPVAGPRAGVLRVGVVRVSAPFQNRGFVYRTGADVYATDFYNEFAAPPARCCATCSSSGCAAPRASPRSCAAPRLRPTGCWRRASSRSTPTPAIRTRPRRRISRSRFACSTRAPPARRSASRSATSRAKRWRTARRAHSPTHGTARSESCLSELAADLDAAAARKP